MSDSINKQIKRTLKNSEVKTHSQEQVYDLLELIDKYDRLINGTKESYGLLNCLDSYYNNSFAEDLAEIQTLRNDLKIN